MVQTHTNDVLDTGLNDWMELISLQGKTNFFEVWSITETNTSIQSNALNSRVIKHP
jgi:hypothetical protein